MQDIINEKTIDDLKEYKFRIPLYQRPYAWGEDEIMQLVVDLDTFKERNKNKKYFLGNIVVSRNGEYLDVIDGQQRLTTLYLIMKYVDFSTFELIYEIREEDEAFLKRIDFDKPTATFQEAIEVIKTIDKAKLKALIEIISLTITELPDEIDVVKYFEVMNNRGKQLEKHQILKAKFLYILECDKSCDNELKENQRTKSYDYAKIWDYCSEMSSTIEDLIYYNDFSENQKEQGAVFGLRQDLLRFKCDENNLAYFKFSQDNNSYLSIIDALSKNESNEEREYRGRKEYRSIVKFSIFLIQVLKLFIIEYKLDGQKGFKSLDKIIVNDRYLLDYFYEDENHSKFLFDDATLAKKFILFLLQMRILFDYFVFKRDEEEQPVLIGRENKKLLMIELLFNFTSPQYFSQDWLIVYLSYLYKNCKKIYSTHEKDKKIEFNDSQIVSFLEKVDRNLAIVRLNKGEILKALNEMTKTILENSTIKKECYNGSLNGSSVLNKGVATPHYWFYKLDYLLWKDYNWNQKFCCSFNELDEKKIKEKFRLTRLHSIEHIAPQSKKSDFENDGCNIDCFGNLALISNHLNSSLSDEKFEVKRTIIEKQIKKGTIESLKMLLIYSKYQEWNCTNCKEHHEEMLKILQNSLQDQKCSKS